MGNGRKGGVWEILMRCRGPGGDLGRGIIETRYCSETLRDETIDKRTTANKRPFSLRASSVRLPLGLQAERERTSAREREGGEIVERLSPTR